MTHTGGGPAFVPDSTETIIVNGLIGTVKVNGIPGLTESGKEQVCVIKIIFIKI